MRFFKQKGTNKVAKLTEEEIREQDSRNIFTHAIYHGVDKTPYNLSIRDLKEQGRLDDIPPAVQARAELDGEWCITMGYVGENNENEDKMRRMMAFVGNPVNIWQAIESLVEEEDLQGKPIHRTVDFLCRDLANASKWAVNAKRPDPA